MSSSCCITFKNNSTKVYFSGQLLSGSVLFTVTEEVKIKGIYIVISGNGHCQWSRDNRTYIGDENYLESQTYVVGNQEGNVVLAAGKYTYPFEHLLSLDLPSSLEGKYGYIRYKVSVVLDRASEESTQFEELFTVIKSMDLNNDPLLRNPITFEKEKAFYLSCLLCCWQLQPLKIIGSLPVGGYTPGEAIDFTVTLENNNHYHLHGILVQFVEEISYHTLESGDKITETIIVDEKKINDKKVILDREIKINIDIPPLPTSDLTASKVCKVSYHVEVIGLVTGWCQKNPVLRMPVTIGTYPIKKSTVSTFNDIVANGLQDSTNVGVISKPPETITY